MIKDAQLQGFMKSMTYVDPLLDMSDLATCVWYQLTQNKSYSYMLGKCSSRANNAKIAAYNKLDSTNKLLDSPFLESVVETIITNYLNSNPDKFNRIIGENKAVLMSATHEGIDKIESSGMTSEEIQGILESIIKGNFDDPDLRLKAIEKYDKLFPLKREEVSADSHIVILPPKYNTICPHCGRECLIHTKDG